MASPILGPILIAGAGTFITWFFQRQSDIIGRRQSHRDAELKRANENFSELSKLMDSFAYYNREVVYALVLRRNLENDQHSEANQSSAPGENPIASDKVRWTPEDRASWSKYVKVQEDWNMAHSRHLAETKKIFGDEAQRQLENIQNDFTGMQNKVQATFFNRKESEFYLLETGDIEETPRRERERDHFPRYDEYLKYWDVVSQKIESLNELMLDKIQSEHVGRL